MADTDGLVERLRNPPFADQINTVSLHNEAADYITFLEAQLAEMREALAPFARWADIYPSAYPDDYAIYGTITKATGEWLTIMLEDVRRARAILSTEGRGG